MSAEPMDCLDRRALLRSAFLIVGGIGLAPEALAQAAAGAGAGFFTAPERGTVAALCDTMIPRTDTPGAVDAKVPQFLDSLMTNWASAASQAKFRDVVTRLEKSARAELGMPLASAPAAARTAWLTRQDAALLGANDAGYRDLKRLLLTGYYFSEPGATVELRYELVPGVWEPSIPITPATRSWAA
ncbi:gluconate 2-dehydrogenase subunit 3 family protein [Sphingomonas sp. Tas61C01]|uniref:gluconate 2-dehydrogenase subunit 3 family protein n=1 Tax=Sphingomonas sp. Tas61C01 TaxID=3458297 RepID=UPI00403E46E5